MSAELQCVVQLLSQKDQQLQTLKELKEQLQSQQRDDAARDAIISSAVALIQQAQSDLCAAVVAQQAQLALDPAVHQVFSQLQQFLPELRQLLAVSPKHSSSAQPSAAAGTAAAPFFGPSASGAQQQSSSPHSGPGSSSSAATSAGDPMQQQPRQGSSGGTAAEVARLNRMLDSVPMLTETMPVQHWSKSVRHTLASDAAQLLIGKIGMSEQELVLQLKGKVGGKVPSGVLANMSVSDLQSPETLITALEAALAPDEVGLERAIRVMQCQPGASAQQILQSLRAKFQEHRVPLPEDFKRYEILVLSFPSDAQRYLQSLMTGSKAPGGKFTWNDFHTLCAKYDQSTKTGAEPKQQQPSAPQSFGGSKQQSGGKQVRFSPSANGAAFEEELPRSPPPQQQHQRSRGGYGRGKGVGRSQGGGSRYEDTPPDYGGHYGASHTAGGLRFGHLAGGVLRPSFNQGATSPLGRLSHRATQALHSSSSFSRCAGGATFLGSRPRAAAAVNRPLSGAALGSLLVTGQPLGQAAGVSNSTSGLSEITPAEDPVSAVVSSSQPSSSSSAVAAAVPSFSAGPGGSSSSSVAAAAGAANGGAAAFPAAAQQFPSLEEFFSAVAAATTGPTLRRRPRSAEPVVPDNPAGAAAPAPVAAQEPDPALVRLRHQLSNLQLPMMLRTLIAAISSPDFQPLREGLCQLGQALQLPNGVVDPAAVGGVMGALTAAVLADDTGVGAAQAEQPAPAVAGTCTGAVVQQQPGSVAGIACGSVGPSSVAGTAGSTQCRSSSSSSSQAGPRPPATPYRDAVECEVATVPFTSPFKVTGGVLGRQFSMVVDTGCTFSVMDQSWFLRNRHIFFYPGSPVQLLAFEQKAPALGVMLGGAQTEATYMLRNVPLEVGEGIYPVNFLVMPHSIFEVALGLEFVDAYAVQLSTKAYGNPNSKPRLVIPTPKSFCHPRVQKKWEAGWQWYNNCVPATFAVGPERFNMVVVDPRALSA
jgi:hypothetical protein